MNLLDTDVVLELLQERRHEMGAISVITLIEVLRGVEAGKRAKVKGLLEESFSLLNLDSQVIEAYCNMYRKLRGEGTPIPEADLLIAATAISHNIAIRTRDEHFKRLTELGLRLARAAEKP